MILRLM